MRTAAIILISLACVVSASAQTYSNNSVSSNASTIASPAISNSTSATLLRNPIPSPAVGHDITGFTSKTATAINPAAARAEPNPNIKLKPVLGGVFVAGAKYGTVMISPTAPATYGMGERYLSAPSTRYDLERETGSAAHRDAGGIKLFTLEF